MRITQAKQKNARYLYLYIEGEYALAAHAVSYTHLPNPKRRNTISKCGADML